MVTSHHITVASSSFCNECVQIVHSWDLVELDTTFTVTLTHPPPAVHVQQRHIYKYYSTVQYYMSNLSNTTADK